MGMREKINLKLLREEIRAMGYHSPIFHVLKEELGHRGYWKNRPRANPQKGYAVACAKRQVMQRGE